ncbi:MAG TPA: aminotransferase class I/II-fold pyridoxal phosphate-dependent enzyme, partial [Candidatus Aminicenantes bacterium]|nr:aminotransferase class I/II-fold pyridoxal phosphate-dependent enzyme [Candidatus Aminicenantes bacterium]
IDQIGGIPYRLPDGAFYFFADFSAPIARKGLADDNALALDILDKLNLILVPGSSFGAPGYLRISYATSMADLATGLDRLAAYVAG